MIPGFGKQSIVIGSAPNADVRLSGPGVAPEHARLVNDGSGKLSFVAGNAGPSTANGQPVAGGSSVPFDFRTQFAVAQTPVPMVHPAITLMLIQAGQGPKTPGRVSFGRDPARCNFVVQHPNVSGLHATFGLSPLVVVDNGSTSGTWIGQQRLEPSQPRNIDAGTVVAVGPIPMPTSLAIQLGQSVSSGAAPPMTALSPAQHAPQPQAAASGAARPRHKTVVGQVTLGLEGQASSKTIGRTPDNDIRIEHAQVSSKHAKLHKIGDETFIEDRGSANGTFVDGHRIAPGQRVKVENGQKVFIGPMPLMLQIEANDVAVVVEDSVDWEGRPLYEIEAWDLLMQVPDRDNPRELKTLLNHVSFKALPGDFIALMGPSGAGKTTLLLTLNGYMPPSAGQVRINGEDLYAIYDNLRGSIGYVPQDDIVHPELTVWEAVRYSAKFRLPPDYSEEEIDRRVSTTLQQLGLESVQHLQIGKPERKILSGGQRKRVNIAMELVTDPVIMFLDEPTSGLAADDTAALVGLLQSLARKTGKTIIATIHQPAKEEFEKFNLTLILGPGGIPMYYGPTAPDGYQFFGSVLEEQGQKNDVDNPRDMFDMLNVRERPIWESIKAQGGTRFDARQASAREWNQVFYEKQHPTFQKMYSGARAVGAGTASQGITQTRPKTKGQFGLLFSRYFRVKMRDVAGTSILLAQAPIIGVLLALVFAGQKAAIPYWCLGALQELMNRSGEVAKGSTEYLSKMQPTTDNTGPIFFLVVAAVWFGTSNAAREVVSERAIYVRERMVNLGLFNYIFSKLLLLGLFVVVQCTVLLAIVFFALDFHGGIAAFGISLFTMIATAMNSVVLGLLVSTMVTSSEASMALTPIALIPQVVLGGLMVPMTTNPALEWPMYIMPARWGFQGVVAQERLAIAADPAWVLDLQRPDTNSAPDFVVSGKFMCAEAQIASDSFNGAWGFVDYATVWMPFAVLGTMSAILLVVILVILKGRDAI